MSGMVSGLSIGGVVGGIVGYAAAKKKQDLIHGLGSLIKVLEYEKVKKELIILLEILPATSITTALR